MPRQCSARMAQQGTRSDVLNRAPSAPMLAVRLWYRQSRRFESSHLPVLALAMIEPPFRAALMTLIGAPPLLASRPSAA